jgi:hypothetical protein
MKKGVEIIPEENYRLRNEDNYTPQQKDFGSKSSMSSSSRDTANDTVASTPVESFSN